MKKGPFLKIINALWLYIKLNRLYDGDNEKSIISNAQLYSLFGVEKVEFH
jgi:chromatin remodeling complex protein RSC6